MLTEPAVFEEGHHPRRLLHREGDLDAVVHGLDSGGVILHGPSGVGKTTVARHALDHLADERGAETAHVQCLGASTATIIRTVLRQLPGPDPPANTPQEDLCLRLYERVDRQTVVALDEAAHVHETDALDRLLDVDGLSVLVICHDPDEWLSVADRAVRQRLSTTPVGLDRFGTAELADILAVRAEQGLRRGAWERAQLERIADDVSGVARAGIQTLRAAARASERRGYDRIHDSVLADAQALAQRRILTHNLHSLPIHHQILYEVVRQAGSLRSTELHAKYEAIADDVYANRALTPLAKRSRRRKLGKLVDYELLEVEGVNRNRVFSVADAEVGPPVGIEVPAVE